MLRRANSWWWHMARRVRLDGVLQNQLYRNCVNAIKGYDYICIIISVYKCVYLYIYRFTADWTDIQCKTSCNKAQAISQPNRWQCEQTASHHVTQLAGELAVCMLPNLVIVTCVCLFVCVYVCDQEMFIDTLTGHDECLPEKDAYCSFIHFICHQRCLLDLLSCKESTIPHAYVSIHVIVPWGSPGDFSLHYSKETCLD